MKLVTAMGATALAAALAGPTAACSGGPEPPGVVLLVGDSLFFQAAPHLERSIEDLGWDVEVDAVIGAGIEGGGVSDVDWSARLDRRLPGLDPEIVVVELGTNGCGPGCDSIPDAVTGVMQDLEDVPVVLWLTVRTDAPRPDEAEAINAALEDAAERWHNLDLLRFDDWFAGRPELLSDDGVHLSGAGRDELAARVQEGIRQHTDDRWLPG